MYKIAVIGDKKSIALFSFFGFLTYDTDNENEALDILKELQNENIGIIYITEKLYAKINEKRNEKIRDMPFLFTLITGISGNTGEGKKTLDITIKKAMGGIK